MFACALVSAVGAFPAGASADDIEITDAISREFTVFNDLTPTDPTDAISRELTAFNDLVPLDPTDAISRELTAFNDLINPVEITDAVSREFTVFPVTSIELGVPYQDMLATGQRQFFKVTLPADRTVRFSLDHVSPQAWVTLYASLGVPPEVDKSDFVSETTTAPHAEITIPTTQAGTYYILATCTRGTEPPYGTGFTILAKDLPFGIERVTPPVVGAGEVTVDLTGARFDATTQYRLVDPATGQESVPLRLTIQDASHARARFDLSTAMPGVYDAVARNGSTGIESRLTRAVAVELARPLSIDTQIAGFPVARRGRDRIGSVHIRNSGNLDVPYCELHVGINNAAGVSMSFSVPTLNGRKEVLLSSADPTVYQEVVSQTLLLGRIPAGRSVYMPCILNVGGVYADEQGIVFADCRPLSRAEYVEGIYLGDIYRALTAARNDPSLPVVTDDEFFASVADILGVARDHPPDYDQAETTAALARSKQAPFRGEEKSDEACWAIGFPCLWCEKIPHVYAKALCPVACYFLVGCCLDPCLPLCPTRGNPECAPDCRASTRAGKVGPGPCAISYICKNIPVFSPWLGVWECQWSCSVHQPACMQMPRSFDPNEKLGPVGFGPAAYVRTSLDELYHVGFENLESAGAPAAEVRVTDTLDSNLDMATFRLKTIRFGDTTLNVPAGRSAYHTTVDLSANLGVIVEIDAGIKAGTNEAYWEFKALDPVTGLIPEDPYKGFLPPNDVTGRGEGWVEYTIKPKSDVATGTIIRNSASIVFDFNPPIVTNEVFNTIDAGTPSSAVLPLSAIAYSPSIPLAWAGADDAGGSGVATYSVYVSTDGEPYAAFLTNSAETSGVFVGQRGHHYAFYATATDNVGNVEAAHATPDAVTFVPAPGDFDGNGKVGADDFGVFKACFTGPGVLYAAGGCTLPADIDGRIPADFDRDGDVDQADFGVFQRCYSGTKPADPNCGG